MKAMGGVAIGAGDQPAPGVVLEASELGRDLHVLEGTPSGTFQKT